MSAAERIPFVGLTGGIAAGKSAALAALGRLGAATLSADAVVHELLAGDEIRDLVVERFGDEVAPNGSIDRAALGVVVFEHPDRRAWLERELWPRVGARIEEWRRSIEDGGTTPPAMIVEVPLLFEAGMAGAFDHTIAIVAGEQVRAGRAAARGHSGLESRTDRQLSQDEKAQRADFAVRNDGSIEDLERVLSETLATIGR